MFFSSFDFKEQNFLGEGFSRSAPTPAVPLSDDLQVLATGTVWIDAPKGRTARYGRQRKKETVPLWRPERTDLAVGTVSNVDGLVSAQSEHKNFVGGVFRADEGNLTAVGTDRRGAQARPFI